MQVNIKATNLEITPEIKKVIEEKISPLDRFVSGIKMPLEAFVEVGLVSRHHHKGDIFYAETNIGLPGKIIRSEAKEDNLFKAINVVKDELQLLLKKYVKKQIAKKEKSAQALKK
jgi:ribosomal subunit interface protein